MDNLLAWKVIYRMCDEYFKNSVSVLLKQGVPDQNFVDWFLKLAKKHKCIIGFYHLQAPKEAILQRITGRTNAQRNVLRRKMDKLDHIKKEKNWSKARVLESIQKHEAIHFKNATIIDTSQMKPVEIATFILKDLNIGNGGIA